MKFRGAFKAPGDKSISHRIALFSLLANGLCGVTNFSPCQDCNSSVQAVNSLGGEAEFKGDLLLLKGQNSKLKSGHVDCGNSGTTMRMLMGLLAGIDGNFHLDGDESLCKRPMRRVADPLALMGADIKTNQGKAPIVINGKKLTGQDHKLKIASAQLKSALLLSGLNASGKTQVLEPAESRDHTERLLQLLGALITHKDLAWQIQASNLEMPSEFRVPGDLSSAAFFVCGAVISPESQVTADDVLLNPTRAGFLTVLERMGAKLEIENLGKNPEPWGKIKASYTKNLKACVIEPSEIPLLVDEVPILALVASQAKGTTIFRNIGELRVKESDRIAAISSQLSLMGVKIFDKGDDLFVEGPCKLAPPKQMDSFSDHRIAMTLAIACAMADKKSQIKDMESAGISYPGFEKTLSELCQ